MVRAKTTAMKGTRLLPLTDKQRKEEAAALCASHPDISALSLEEARAFVKRYKDLYEESRKKRLPSLMKKRLQAVDLVARKTEEAARKTEFNRVAHLLKKSKKLLGMWWEEADSSTHLDGLQPDHAADEAHQRVAENDQLGSCYICEQ